MLFDEQTKEEKQELKLVYVNKIGKDSGGFNTYEFLFSTDLSEIDGENWGEVPACVANVSAPDNEFIDCVKTLKCYYIEFCLAQDNTQFNMWDVVEDILPLAWENKGLYETYPTNVLIFRFGESLYEIENRLVNWNSSNKNGDKERNEQSLFLN